MSLCIKICSVCHCCISVLREEVSEVGLKSLFLLGHKLGPFFPSFLRFPTFKCRFSYMLGLPYVVPSLVLNQVLPWFKGIVVLPVSHCACWG